MVKQYISESTVQSVASPCVSICALNDEDVCVGCYRSGEEISSWGSLSEQEKQEVMLRVQEREKAAYI